MLLYYYHCYNNHNCYVFNLHRVLELVGHAGLSFSGFKIPCLSAPVSFSNFLFLPFYTLTIFWQTESRTARHTRTHKSQSILRLFQIC